MTDESKTPDLVELAERTVDATKAGDLDALLGLYSPDAVWDSADPDLPGERFEGRAAIRSLFEEWFGTIEDVQVEAEEIRDVGRGVVFAHLVQRASPRGSAAAHACDAQTTTCVVPRTVPRNQSPALNAL